MNAKQHALVLLAFTRDKTNRLLEDIPEDKLLHQPVPSGNHALWVMGHLAYADDTFATFYDGGGTRLPPEHAKLFGMGSRPTADPAAYPPPAQVRERFAATRQRILDAAEAAGAALLDEPLPEDFQSFAPDKLGMLLSIAWHEGLHAGQLTTIRRSLGIDPIFG